MRIVAGTAGGRRILTPEGEDVRPTSERVREAIFNSLFSHGLTEGAKVLDLFAGSGALGLEALSRGAAHVTFVDSRRASIECVRANVEALGFTDRATVRTGDAPDHARAAGSFDLALVDPPYAFDRWEDLLDAIDAATVVIESDRPVDPGSGRRILKQKRYAGTVVTIATSERTVDDQPSTREQEAPPA
jgi:16S rRNA (guanine966-N2)-methyltransferase